MKNNVAYSSAVSWSAVMGGAFVTAALSVTLLSLGTGLGLSALSPWANVGATASSVGTAAIIWLIVMQIISSAMGGYLAGRLRTKWASVHTHEVYFRDTAHGFLVWAVALVITASFMAGAATSMVGGATHVAGTDQGEGRRFDPEAYFVSTLLRSDRSTPDRYNPSVNAEVGYIFMHAIRQKEILEADKTYLTSLVMGNTGLLQPEAEKRITEVFLSARESAESARKIAAHVFLWLFIALLTGAFCASYAATIGGRQRDSVEALMEGL